MKLLFIIFLIVFSSPVSAWSAKAHRLIADAACRYMPESSVIKCFAEDIVKRSPEPDFVRENDNDERYGHFMSMDAYDDPPFKNIPLSYDGFMKKYSAKTIRRNGMLPWRVQEWYNRLVNALKAKNRNDIIKASAFLTHYIADSAMPLHAVSNYDGQKSGNRGIHSRFETVLFGLMKDSIIFTAPKITTVKIRSEQAVFENLCESFACADAILEADKKSLSAAGYVYYGKYYRELEKYTGHIVRERLQRAVELTVNIWRSAELEAGIR